MDEGEEEEDMDELVAAELPPLNNSIAGNSGAANGSSLEAYNGVVPLVVRDPLSLAPRRATESGERNARDWGESVVRHEGGLLVHARVN